MGNVLAPDRRGHRLARLGRGDLGARATCCATARTRTSAPRSTATASSSRRARRRPSSCTARRCPTTTTSTPTPPGGRRYDHDDPCVAIIKHANPCGIAVGADIAEAHRKAHACDPVSAFGGVIAANRPVDARDGRAGRRGLHRGGRRAGVRRRRAGGAGREEEHPAAACAATCRPRGAEMRPVSGGLLLQAATGSTPPATTRRRGAGRAASRPTTATLADLVFAWRAVPRGEVQRDPAGRRRRDRRRRHGPGQPGRLRPAGRRAGGGAGGRLGRGLRRVLPVRRRAAGAARRRRPRRRAAGRVGARRGGRRRGRAPPASRCTSPAPGTSPTDAGRDRRAAPRVTPATGGCVEGEDFARRRLVRRRRCEGGRPSPGCRFDDAGWRSWSPGGASSTRASLSRAGGGRHHGVGDRSCLPIRPGAALRRRVGEAAPAGRTRASSPSSTRTGLRRCLVPVGRTANAVG